MKETEWNDWCFHRVSNISSSIDSDSANKSNGMPLLTIKAFLFFLKKLFFQLNLSFSNSFYFCLSMIRICHPHSLPLFPFVSIQQKQVKTVWHEFQLLQRQIAPSNNNEYKSFILSIFAWIKWYCILTMHKLIQKKNLFSILFTLSLFLYEPPPLSPSSPSLYFSISIALWVLYIPQKQLCRVIKRATIKQWNFKTRIILLTTGKHS